jgi:hypothetical protein
VSTYNIGDPSCVEQRTLEQRHGTGTSGATATTTTNVTLRRALGERSVAVIRSKTDGSAERGGEERVTWDRRGVDDAAAFDAEWTRRAAQLALR